MKIAIFAINRTTGIKKLEEIIGEYKYKEVKRFAKGQNEAFAELYDGTYYFTAPASENSRGYRMDKAYVENGVSNDIIDIIIRPHLCISKLPYEEQIEFFN